MRTSEAASSDDAPTRMRVVQSILESGPLTAVELAERLSLTPAAVRRHLDRLVDDGAVESREQRVVGQRGRGRPARAFVLTDSGRDKFEHSYDDLAVAALRYLSQSGGDEAIAGFARHRLDDLSERYRALLSDTAEADRPRVLAEALTRDGFAASSSSTPLGEQICQHHCPIAHVAEEFPQLCEAETAMFAELLGSHVQRLATIAHGDGICTTHLPRTIDPINTPSRSTTSERVSS